ncbi:hypothetical protein NMB32_19690 [Stenotrophomonas sp. CD2]|nr:hypothetical protein NMB32_19690 [Stenotrophomonas sp. CD2]
MKITAVTGDGRTVEVFSAPGSNGVNRLMSAGQVERLDDSSRITWTGNGVSVPVEMRIVRRAGEAAQGGGDWQRGLQLPERVAGGEPAAPAVPAAAPPATPAPAPAPAAGGAR